MLFCLLGFLSGDYFFKDLLSDFLLLLCGEPGAWCVYLAYKAGILIEQIDRSSIPQPDKLFVLLRFNKYTSSLYTAIENSCFLISIYLTLKNTILSETTNLQIASLSN